VFRRRRERHGKRSRDRSQPRTYSHAERVTGAGRRRGRERTNYATRLLSESCLSGTHSRARKQQREQDHKADEVPPKRPHLPQRTKHLPVLPSDVSRLDLLAGSMDALGSRGSFRSVQSRYTRVNRRRTASGRTMSFAPALRRQRVWVVVVVKSPSPFGGTATRTSGVVRVLSDEVLRFRGRGSGGGALRPASRRLARPRTTTCPRRSL